MPVGELRRRVTEREFRHYAALLAHESPLGETQDRFAAATLAGVVNPYRQKDAEPLDPAKLVPEPWVEKQDVRDRRQKLRDMLRSVALLHGGEVIDGR